MSNDTLIADAAVHSRSSINPDAETPCVLSAAGVRRDVQCFISAHRQEGHRFAALDPMGVAEPLDANLLSPARFGLSPTDPVTEDGKAWLGAQQVQELDRTLKAAYCGALALDCSAVRDPGRREWLYARMESLGCSSPVDGKRLLDRLIHAQAWEHHVAARFPDAKRFSLEGCESLVPLLGALIEEAAAHGLGDIFMGMPHRGRVNVLVNVLGVPPADILDYFDPDSPHPEMHRDLVYHLGGSHVVATSRGDVAVTLAHNPSHLQSVYPVVTGMAHASQTLETSHKRAMALVLHGDAAFAGQGVVMETLAMTQKPGYCVGGAVHVIINNQVGFTELNLMSAAQARYCTDVTRMIDVPVLRVNADAPEQVLRAAAIAIEYRMAFGSDVVIDLIGYRRLGHSEHDLPMLTNPVGYTATERKPSVVEVYGATLVAAGVASQAEVASSIACGRSAATAAFSSTATRSRIACEPAPGPATPVAPLTQGALRAAVSAMLELPAGFQPHPHIQTLIERWHRLANGEAATADWCFAENLAYASILSAGVDVRISGLDVRRGTFMHRQAVWHNQAPQRAADEAFIPLQRLDTAARFDVVNSVLSEEAVLGFEYGYSVQAARGLTIWEAQFGDFVNGAQVFIDQYISAGEEKWGARSALAMLLPHGHEGVGPEHSNAHLGRFLSLCGGDNMRVVYPSTSAQMFHLLRRQAFCEVRKPLVVMTPKGTLYKEPASHSPVEHFLAGEFQPVLDDDDVTSPSEVSRLVLCSGKLYYQLERARLKHACADVALVRLEELYPFPKEGLARTLARYGGLRTVVWAQEENLNQGAWAFVRDEIALACPAGVELQCVARPSTASGATSSYAVHRRQERELIERAMGIGATER